MEEIVRVGPFMIYWIHIRKCFWIEREDGSGMDLYMNEFEKLLADYWAKTY